MAVEVKGEIFGSRPSIIEPILKSRNITYIKDVFILTCRAEFNKDVKTRYLVLIEFKNMEDMTIDRLNEISKCLKEYIKDRIIGVSLKEKEKKAYLLFSNNEKKELSFNEFKEFLLKETNCKYKESIKKGSKQATALSRFFRENLGKSVSITDIDFFLPTKCLFIEEKTFVEIDEKGKYGYLAQGQCFSYRELTNDLIDSSKASLYLIFVNDNNEFYIKNFQIEDINCFESEKKEKWGNMVKIRLDSTPLSKDDLIKFVESS